MPLLTQIRYKTSCSFRKTPTGHGNDCKLSINLPYFFLLTLIYLNHWNPKNCFGLLKMKIIKTLIHWFFEILESLDLVTGLISKKNIVSVWLCTDSFLYSATSDFLFGIEMNRIYGRIMESRHSVPVINAYLVNAETIWGMITELFTYFSY